MSRTAHRLTARQISNASPQPGERLVLSDGGHLYLQVTHGANSINRSWIFRYERDGKRHDLGLGAYPTRTLAAARKEAHERRVELLDNPVLRGTRQQKRAERLAKAAEDAKAMTFRQCAVAYIESHNAGWTNAEHRRQWVTTLEQDVFPTLGDLPVAQIETPHIVKVLQPIWQAKPETASRVRGRIERVLGWAQVRGFRLGDNPARWRGHLAELFPAKGKLALVKHHAAMPYVDVPAFLADLAKENHLAARALEFTILTAARSGEVLGATWSEFDFAAKTWVVPASRMKAKREHRVPLSDRVLAILRALPRDGERVFPLEKLIMGRLLRDRLNHPDVTVHGFRSSFRDWAAERTRYPDVVAEQALAHAVGSQVMRAYHRTDLFEKRRRLMSEWATFCSRPVPTGEKAKVLSMMR
jgi:integrase